jgi:hypothetical protein
MLVYCFVSVVNNLEKVGFEGVYYGGYEDYPIVGCTIFLLPTFTLVISRIIFRPEDGGNVFN